MSSDGKLKVGYWKIRGLVEAIRMMLKYAEVDFDDVIYECGDAPEFDKSCWFDIKHKLGLDFPNLPYVMDGDVKLTQTIPVLHYLADKYGMAPTATEKFRCEMIDHVGMDMALTMARLCYNSADHFNANKENTVKSGKAFIKQMSEALGKQSYFAGEKITGTDFWIFENIDKYTHLDENIVEHANIKAWMTKILEAPTLQCYFTKEGSSRKYPLNNKMAFFK